MTTPPTAPWHETQAWPEEPRIVLQASAGTGKTYQIAALVTRLVAERGVPIEKILVMTFTNAAATELRDRIRRRMQAAATALALPPAAKEDLLHKHLRQPAFAADAGKRLALALADFDRAAISTIHAFCQKTLQQFAFESQQDFDLQLLADPAELREQLVADALANIYANCTVDQMAVADDMGWTRKNLEKVVEAMTGVAEPTITPPLPQSVRMALRRGQPAWRVARDAIQGYDQLVNELTDWLDSPAGQTAAAAFQLERDQPQGIDARGKPFKRIDADMVGSATRNLAWMRRGALWTQRPPSKPVDWLRYAKFAQTGTWKGPGRAQDEFAGWPLIERYEAFLTAAEPFATLPLSAFAAEVRASFNSEIGRQALQTYNSMIANLADRLQQEALADGATGALTAALRKQFAVGLIDEFQDTDAAQWSILRHIFSGAEKHQLFLIGDPKQSIYSFRNADIAVYLAATDRARAFDLDTNFRSDGPLVSACNEVWSKSDAPFGAGTGIAYTDVHAHHPAARLTGLGDRPLHLRWIPLPPDATTMTKNLGQRLSAQLCAEECRAMLDAKPQLKPDKDRPAVPLLPGHIAVLVHSHTQGKLVQNALAGHRIAAVSAARGSIFKSDVAPWLGAFLDAVTDPTDEGACRRWAITPLVGWSAVQLAQAIAQEDNAGAAGAVSSHNADWAALRKAVALAATNWPKYGFTRVLEMAMAAHDTMPRLLGSPYGERAATDLRHLIELCHAEERRIHASPRTLAQWLRQQSAKPNDANDEQTLRLQSDDDAVQIVTIHTCKGLQYPVVLLPFAWWYREPKGGDEPLLAPGADGQRELCLAAKGSPSRADALRRQKEAQDAEAMRLLYVAITRAQHRCVAWLCPTDAKGVGSAATRLMRRAAADASEPATPVNVFGQHPCIAVENNCQLPSQMVPWQRPEPAPIALLPAALANPEAMGQNWQIASYSGLTKNLHVDGALTEERGAQELLGEPDQRRDDDDDDEVDGQPPQRPIDDVAKRIADEQFVAQFAAPQPDRLVPVPGAVLPKGTKGGNWLHKVLEDLQFSLNDQGLIQAKDGRPALELIQTEGIRHGYKDPIIHAAMLALLADWLDTPLGIDALTLRHLPPQDRIDELEFDLRLASGAQWSPQLRKVAGQLVDSKAVRLALSDATQNHPQAQAFGGRDWLKAYLADKTKAGEEHKFVGAIAGILNGKIDLLLRHGGRYYVADYKGNWIKGAEAHRALIPPAVRFDAKGRPALLQEHYTTPAMRWVMGDHAYHLQALIYTVAVHRMLAHRMAAAYDIDDHLGGHRYLFVRGMLGPATPVDGATVLGVFADRWPSRTVVGLSAALSGCNEAAVTAAMDALVDPTFGGAR